MHVPARANRTRTCSPGHDNAACRPHLVGHQALANGHPYLQSNRDRNGNPIAKPYPDRDPHTHTVAISHPGAQAH